MAMTIDIMSSIYAPGIGRPQGISHRVIINLLSDIIFNLHCVAVYEACPDGYHIVEATSPQIPSQLPSKTLST